MKHRDVILDFTSLLDIVLLILFFFILYSAFNVQESEKRVAEDRQQYEEKLAALEDEKAELRAEQDSLDAEWKRLQALDENAVKNQQALSAFSEGRMLCFRLEKEDDSDEWTLSATRKKSAEGEEETVGEIRSPDQIKTSIDGILEEAGCGKDDVLIITFLYNGDVIGTHRLYGKIMEAFRSLQAERKNVYLCAINLSK